MNSSQQVSHALFRIIEVHYLISIHFNTLDAARQVICRIRWRVQARMARGIWPPFSLFITITLALRLRPSESCPALALALCCRAFLCCYLLLCVPCVSFESKTEILCISRDARVLSRLTTDDAFSHCFFSLHAFSTVQQLCLSLGCWQSIETRWCS